MLRIPTLEMVIVSNSAKFVSSIVQAAFAREGTPAGDRLKLLKQLYNRLLEIDQEGRRAVVLIDEAQNCTYGQIKMLLTRLGWNSTMVVTGDPARVTQFISAIDFGKLASALR